MAPGLGVSASWVTVTRSLRDPPVTETVHQGNWVKDVWLLYNAMECESAHGALPTLHTYTLILQAWVRFGPESENPVTLSGSIIQGP